MSIDLYLRFLLALAGIIALIVVLAFLARRFGLVRGVTGGGAARRLAVVEVTAVDAKRRLVLLRRDDTEHLVLLGPDSAVVVESGITARRPSTPPRDFRATLSTEAAGEPATETQR
jgi:flagellar protein FliO/FliZ